MQGYREVAPGDLSRTFARATRPMWSVRSAVIALMCGAIALITGCSRSAPEQARTTQSPSPTLQRHAGATQSPSSRVQAATQSVSKGGGVYKLGKPYKIAGRWYFPQEDPHYDRAGVASWYGADFHGRKTANGEVYDMNALTAAHPTLPIPSYAYVTSLRTRRTVLVRINDRGPYAKDRILDLSRRTAELLGVAAGGISEVRVQYAGRAPLNGDDSAERRFLAAQPWVRTAVATPAPMQPRGAEWQGRMGLMRRD